jgi:hypothetical protein
MVVTASTNDKIDRAVPGQTAITDRDGRYVMPDLVPGTYHIVLFRDCNNAVEQGGIVVEPAKTTVVDLTYAEPLHT